MSRGSDGWPVLKARRRTEAGKARASGADLFGWLRPAFGQETRVLLGAGHGLRTMGNVGHLGEEVGFSWCVVGHGALAEAGHRMRKKWAILSSPLLPVSSRAQVAWARRSSWLITSGPVAARTLLCGFNSIRLIVNCAAVRSVLVRRGRKYFPSQAALREGTRPAAREGSERHSSAVQSTLNLPQGLDADRVPEP